MGIVITVTSGKGGVGKSTAVGNLSVGLANRGKKVVAIDFDIGLRNLDMILGLENRIVYDVIDVMEGKCNLNQALINDKRAKSLYFLPASQNKDKNILDKEKVKVLIEELKQNFDFIIIDSPAGIEGGFEHAIFWADRALIVVTPEVSSVRDADRVIGIIDAKSEKAREGKEVGTYFDSTPVRHLSSRQHWIMYRSMPKGKIIVDDGARLALVNKHTSLLPKGIVNVEGNFLMSQIVDIVDCNNDLIARGIANYSSDEIRLIKGLNSSEIETVLHYKDYDEVVHANNLVLVKEVNK